MASILIVEDEEGLGRTITMSLTDDGHIAHWVSSAEEAAKWLQAREVDLALVDMRLPGRNGIDLLRDMAESHPDTVVIMMSAHGDVRTAVQAMKVGAADFLLKPVDLDAVSLVADKNLRHRRIERNWKHEQSRRSDEFGLHRIMGTCPELQKAKAMVTRLAQITVASNAPPPNVLITGETGTGKDLIARALHYEGPRRDGPFVQVNCAALPETLAESELFGHVKGAFTDARVNKRGLFEMADQGTLFLDEVCSLPTTIQAKLLTVIESRRVRPVGGADERSIDVHIVAAMNRPADELIAAGHFRADLYHRLRVVEVPLPALRDRGADLFLLADYFIAMHCRNLRMENKGTSPGLRQALRAYHWPGNVRELSHCMETAVLLSDDVVTEDVVPNASGGRRHLSGNGDAIPVDFSRGPISLESVERELIVRALRAANQNVSRTAELLAVSRDTLRYRLDKHGIEVKRSGVSE